MPDLQNFGDWPLYALSDIAHYHNGFAFKPKDWSEDGVRIIRIEQLNNPDGPYDRFTGTYPSINHIDDGDLIFSWSATLKVLIWKHGSCVLNQHLFRVDEKEGFDKQYIYYILDYHMDSLAGSSHGSTMKHIKRGELQKYRVPIPSPNKQKKIAIILQTIDRAIAHTEALIEKYHQIKAGLMHDLFTRGIGADGKLRPTREEAPELYQESAIGSIPREWGIKPLAELTSKIVDGVHHTPDYVDHGIPFVTVKNLTGSSSIDFENLNYIDEKTHRMCYSRADPRPGDVLVTKDGTLGTCRIVREDMPEFSIFVSVALIRVTEELTPKWLHFFFDSGSYLKQLGYLSSGTGLKHIHLEHFKKFQIALPKKNEQQQINKRVQIVEDKLSSEKNTLSKLIAEKAGLMHDLLTGKVPVKVNPNEVDHI